MRNKALPGSAEGQIDDATDEAVVRVTATDALAGEPGVPAAIGGGGEFTFWLNHAGSGECCCHLHIHR